MQLHSYGIALFCLFFSILYPFLVLHFTPHTSQHTHRHLLTHTIQPTSALTRLRPFLINNGRCPQLIIPANRLLYNMRSTSDRLLYNMWSDRGWPHRERWQSHSLWVLCVSEGSKVAKWGICSCPHTAIHTQTHTRWHSPCHPGFNGTHTPIVCYASFKTWEQPEVE